MITFEFDEKKSQINLERHGIGFVSAQKLWDDPNLLEVPAKTIDEYRAIAIGEIAGKHWSGVITYRGKNIRIISVRRSRKEEAILYES